jgi:hypothetical protein
LRFSTVAFDDVDAMIKVASMSELEVIRSFAAQRHWGASWHPTAALAHQVDAASPKFLLPAMRTAAGDDGIASIRCHVWFLAGTGPRLGQTSLIDVAVAQFEDLRTLAPDKAIVAMKLIIPAA